MRLRGAALWSAGFSRPAQAACKCSRVAYAARPAHDPTPLTRVATPAVMERRLQPASLCSAQGLSRSSPRLPIPWSSAAPTLSKTRHPCHWMPPTTTEIHRVDTFPAKGHSFYRLRFRSRLPIRYRCVSGVGTSGLDKSSRRSSSDLNSFSVLAISSNFIP